MDGDKYMFTLVHNKKLINTINAKMKTMDIPSKKTGGVRDAAQQLIIWVSINPD